MPDDQKIVMMMRFYAEEASITRPELAEKILGNSVGFAAGIHHRNEEAIGPWPILNPERKSNRVCQFPVGDPLYDDFDVCGNKRTNDQLVCELHKGMIWKPLD